MSGLSDIRYIKRSEIDTARWDLSIEQSRNSLIYGYSFYLDLMSRNWDALILGNYEYIMPLTWNKKWGVKYLYQPPFTQQLGIFSAQSITQDIMHSFLDILQKEFKFAEIFLNYDNGSSSSLVPKNNFTLSLSCDYQSLVSGYRKDLIKNLRHAANYTMNYVRHFDLAKAMSAFKETYSQRTPHISPEDFQHFGDVCLYMQNDVIVRAVTDENNHVLATALLLMKNNRLYLLQSTTLPRGREIEANHFLLDQVIREFSGSNRILDFEGSDIDGIAHFYMNFGSVNQPYYFYKYNRLSWPWSIFKK